MKFALIICTYMRPKALLTLLESVKLQTTYPNEILIIDGSTTTATEVALKAADFNNLGYYRVNATQRGLTKQRNFGIEKVSDTAEVVCFLDDDVLLSPQYFENLMSTYYKHPEALGVGGYITNEVVWQQCLAIPDRNTFSYDGWMREEPLRFRVRKWFGLQPDTPPCFLPSFSHGRSVSFLPPTGKIYPVEHFMGGVSSYKRTVFDTLKFSSYFEGYGLYEDADFCFRLTQRGALYVNTQAQLEHHHEALGRPNPYLYGKMVLRNGWYIWKVRYPKPSFKAKLKWHLTAILLIALTFLGMFISKSKKAPLLEGLGRIAGWWRLWYKTPNVDY